MPVSVRLPDAVIYHEALLWDISWGGALISCEALNAKAGDLVELNIEWPDVDTVNAHAFVLRQVEPDRSDHNSSIQYACRFTEFSLEADQRFRNLLLELFRIPEPKSFRQDPRIAYQLELEYTDQVEFTGLLKHIYHGRAEVMLPAPIKLDDRIILLIYGPGGAEALDMRARVVNQELARVSDVEVYRVNLAFEHPTNELRERVHKIMSDIVPDYSTKSVLARLRRFAKTEARRRSALGSE